MKKVVIIYRNRDSQDAMDYIEGTLKKVFEDYIEIERCYFNELVPGQQVAADGYLVLDHEMIYLCSPYLSSMENIIVMTRSMNKDHLPKLLQIEEKTDVLVVNDSPISTSETLYMLLEMGIGHVHMIPFSPEQEKKGAYRKIQWAVTPAETQMVPSYIKNVVDIGYREVGFEALVRLMYKLDLDNDVVNRNLLMYLQNIVEPSSVLHSNYMDSFLKSRIMNSVIFDPLLILLALDDQGEILFENETAQELDFDKETRLSLLGEPISNKLITLQNTNYLLSRKPIEIAGWRVCTLLSLRSEKNLRDTEQEFRNKLQEKGAVARYSFEDIVGCAPKMNDCITLAKKAAKTDFTLLLRGESGSGKELFAQSIHNYSARRNRPFVAINCAAIPDSLLESELFGYEGGSFTGAKSKGRIGLFEQAEKGTIFLDEIGDISPALQASLLRVLQEKQIMRIGSDRTVDVDVRIIAATNQDLLAKVEEGTFRKDLYYRLSVIPIVIPPLRQRKEDVELLIRHFAGDRFDELWKDGARVLQGYDWPGNVRELENAITFYKVFGALPIGNEEGEGRQQSVPDGRADKEQSLRTMRRAILMCLNENAKRVKGTGRPEMLQAIRDQGIMASDGRLRQILGEMEEEGLLQISRGRRGTVITEKGIDTLFEEYLA